MSKEKEMQDELERYWGQLDRIERMLKWLVAELKAECNQPDIMDILEEK